jgi:hypothetical protein
MRYENVSPSEIDGGFEFNGWHLGNRFEVCNPEYPDAANPIGADWDDFTCLKLERRDEYPYTVSFTPKPGYVVEYELTFRGWLPWRQQSLYVLSQ